MKTANLTNEKMLKNLVKTLDSAHPIYSALLRERIVHIMQLTIEDIEKNPEAWNNAFVGPAAYQELNNMVQQTIGFGK